ncbi:hypothetical protein C5Z25_01610 [Lactobacillus sp. CBA3605]|uniref:hypothetical protein n=1 Tax=Lactobacillus sp. CBA3605 TaxID=2099788 RepID=UPI000CFD65CC|nr:hypothetical protein [Lactobacillus sp. CBA3605]AVK60544.1 hypothetical protein C5Z25_01610 [Lactobacillus sp. CBA3605]
MFSKRKATNCFMLALILTDLNLMMLKDFDEGIQTSKYALNVMILIVALGIILSVNHDKWSKVKDAAGFIFLVCTVVIPVTNLMYSTTADDIERIGLMAFMYFGYCGFVVTLPLVFEKYIWQKFLKQSKDDKWKLLPIVIAFISAVLSTIGLVISMLN